MSARRTPSLQSSVAVDLAAPSLQNSVVVDLAAPSLQSSVAVNPARRSSSLARPAIAAAPSQRRKLAATRAVTSLRACNITQRRVAIGHRRGAHGRSAALWASMVTVCRRLDFRPRTFVRRTSVHGLSSVGLLSTDFCPAHYRLASYALLSGALHPASLTSCVLPYCSPVSCVLRTMVVHRVVLCPAAYLAAF